MHLVAGAVVQVVAEAAALRTTVLVEVLAARPAILKLQIPPATIPSRIPVQEYPRNLRHRRTIRAQHPLQEVTPTHHNLEVLHQHPVHQSDRCQQVGLAARIKGHLRAADHKEVQEAHRGLALSREVAQQIAAAAAFLPQVAERKQTRSPVQALPVETVRVAVVPVVRPVAPEVVAHHQVVAVQVVHLALALHPREAEDQAQAVARVTLIS